MKIFDLHQDLLTHVRFKEQLGQSTQTGWSELEESDVDLVVATAFPLPPQDDQLHDSVSFLISEEIAMYRTYLAQNAEWRLVHNATDLSSHQKKLLLHIEGLNTFTGSPDTWQQLEAWVQAGVRSVGTHWNIANHLGGGTNQPNAPLTDLGCGVIKFLEAHDLIFDMAHMGRQSFWDAAAVTSRPLYVSHGNAASVCDSVRNYTDEQLKIIAASDGVIGVFFAQSFVTGKDVPATITDVVTHIKYIKNLIGIRHIAIGTDFGGIITGEVEGLSSVEALPNLFTALQDHGFSETELELISNQNARRVLRAHLSE